MIDEPERPRGVPRVLEEGVRQHIRVGRFVAGSIHVEQPAVDVYALDGALGFHPEERDAPARHGLQLHVHEREVGIGHRSENLGRQPQLPQDGRVAPRALDADFLDARRRCPDGDGKARGALRGDDGLARRDKRVPSGGVIRRPVPGGGRGDVHWGRDEGGPRERRGQEQSGCETIEIAFHSTLLSGVLATPIHPSHGVDADDGIGGAGIQPVANLRGGVRENPELPRRALRHRGARHVGSQ